MQRLNNLVKNLLEFIRRQPRWRLIAVGGIVAVACLMLWNTGGKATGKAPSFSARRGPLEITVLEGGSLQALESQELKCEVRVGYQGTKILRIVEEGYSVTEDDVRTNKVLVELDSSELQKQIVQQEIQYQSAVASLIDAEQAYEIQLNQNQADIKAAEQKCRFARLDFDKFLGDTVTAKIIDEVGLDDLLAAASTNNVQLTSRADEAFEEKVGNNGGAEDKPQARSNAPPEVRAQPPAARKAESIPDAAASSRVHFEVRVTNQPLAQAGPPPGSAGARTAPGSMRPGSMRPGSMRPGSPGATNQPALEGGADDLDPVQVQMTNLIKVDFSKYADAEKLGDGEAKQKIRKFEDDLQMSLKELGQATNKLEGTRRLFAKGFVTKTELQSDEIAFDNSRVKVKSAESARDLFLKYDFLKSAEQALSTYAEMVREYDKARRVAISKAAQAKARLKSAQGQHQVQLRQRNDLNEQMGKCTLSAKKTGLVVYGGSRDDFYYGGDERIREGGSVRERQAIITIPDLSRMSVNVKIHESYIKKIKKGQKARITVDAFPDKVLTGEISKVGVLPDSQNRWMNPDMKVYLTTITLDDTQEWVKPGMSAKVEIMVNKLEDCVYVPVQAVLPEGDKQVCYLAGGDKREVQTGELNDEFIEIKNGVKEGERVLLRRPDGVEPVKPSQEVKPPENGKPAPAKPAAPPAPGTARAEARKT
jgi:multidrug resistance efflux pump